MVQQSVSSQRYCKDHQRIYRLGKEHYIYCNQAFDKGAIVREDPGFICKASVSKRTVQGTETRVLLNKFYDGSLCTFLTDYVKNQPLTKAEVMELERIIAEHRI